MLCTRSKVTSYLYMRYETVVNSGVVKSRSLVSSTICEHVDVVSHTRNEVFIIVGEVTTCMRTVDEQ